MRMLLTGMVAWLVLFAGLGMVGVLVGAVQFYGTGVQVGPVFVDWFYMLNRDPQIW